jgi:GNAT superfamily N-acetyltransferase
MTGEAIVVRDDDPRAAALAADGWRVVAESWGARLELTDELDRSVFERLVDRARASGVEIAELDRGWADAVYELDVQTRDDYPVTPATPAPELSHAEVTALWGDGWQVFGAVADGILVGATTVRRTSSDVVAETGWTAVMRSHRGLGVSTALKAASVLALWAAGARTFATGGAAANDASIAMNRSLGYVFTERWLSLEPPRG